MAGDSGANATRGAGDEDDFHAWQDVGHVVGGEGCPCFVAKATFVILGEATGRCAITDADPSRPSTRAVMPPSDPTTLGRLLSSPEEVAGVSDLPVLPNVAWDTPTLE